LCGKQTGQLALKEIKKNPKAEKERVDWEKLEAKMSFKVMTREEKIQEASKPLYLKRYE
jgi:hypothetical protein